MGGAERYDGEKTALRKPWQCLLIIPAILAGLAAPVSGGETRKVYDRNWKHKRTLRDSTR